VDVDKGSFWDKVAARLQRPRRLHEPRGMEFAWIALALLVLFLMVLGFLSGAMG
jgi:hypothetical protein